MMNKETEQQEVAFIVKADVQGSLTSVIDSLKLLENNEIAVKIVASGVGDITEGDIRVANSTNHAIIYGFNVNLPPLVKQLANRARVEVHLYKIIYELLDDAKTVMSELLPDEVIETPLGELVVKGIFRTTKTDIIAGGKVVVGRLEPKNQARIWRGKGKKATCLGEVEVVSLRREKNEANDIVEGEMCGIELALNNQKITLELDDRIEVFHRQLKKRQLDSHV